MFVKLAVFACSVAATLAAWHGPLAGGQPASLYPAGVSPQACPNFPNCDNPAVAVAGSQSHGAWNGAGAGAGSWNGGHAGQWNGGDNGQWNGGNNGQWNGGNNGQWNGGWNGGHGGQEALNNGEYIGDGDYHGEGLAESGAYGVHDNGNQGNWNNGNQGNWNAAPAVPAYGHQAAAAVPAGVDAHSCPNYPFCH